MHKAQEKFCTSVKMLHPDFFTKKKVLDVGSLDINGNNRYLFTDCDYLGLDITSGKNVDIVMPVHVFQSKVGEMYDTIISTEMLEHDKHWKESLVAMYASLNSSGLLLITCATTGRREHGTAKTRPQDSPATNDYYKNVTIQMLEEAIEGLSFTKIVVSGNPEAHDLYFYGIKK